MRAAQALAVLIAVNDSRSCSCILRAVMFVHSPECVGRWNHLRISMDLSDDPNMPPQPIHLGYRAGRNFVLRFLDGLRTAGVHHVVLNLKYSARNAGDVLDEIGREILPRLNAIQNVPRAA